MSNAGSVRLYFVGRTADEAVKNEPHLWEKYAQEVTFEDDNIYAIEMTVFASRVREVEKW